MAVEEWLKKIDDRTFDTHTQVTELRGEMRRMADSHVAMERRLEALDKRRIKDVLACLGAGAASGAGIPSIAKILAVLLGGLLLSGYAWL